MSQNSEGDGKFAEKLHEIWTHLFNNIDLKLFISVI